MKYWSWNAKQECGNWKSRNLKVGVEIQTGMWKLESWSCKAKLESGNLKIETRIWKLENWSWNVKLECRNLKAESWSWKANSNVGKTWKLEFKRETGKLLSFNDMFFLLFNRTANSCFKKWRKISKIHVFLSQDILS